MNMDLSSSGYLLPLLIAGVVFGLYLVFKPKDAETPDAVGGLLNVLKGGKLSALLPLLVSAFKNKDTILALVSAFVANLGKLFVHPDVKIEAKPKEAEKPK